MGAMLPSCAHDKELLQIPSDFDSIHKQKKAAFFFFFSPPCGQEDMIFIIMEMEASPSCQDNWHSCFSYVE